MIITRQQPILIITIAIDLRKTLILIEHKMKTRIIIPETIIIAAITITITVIVAIIEEMGTGDPIIIDITSIIFTPDLKVINDDTTRGVIDMTTIMTNLGMKTTTHMMEIIG